MDKKHESKVYCCTNLARSEAKILGLLDVIWAVIQLLLSAWLADATKSHSEFLASNNVSKTYEDIFQAIDVESYKIGLICDALLGIMLGSLLFHSARIQNQRLLKFWFFISAIRELLEFSFCVLILTKIRNIVPVIVFVIISWMYNLYEFWIVVRLLKDLRMETSVTGLETGHHTEVLSPASAKSESGRTGVVVLSPTPAMASISDQVYTISKTENADTDEKKST